MAIYTVTLPTAFNLDEDDAGVLHDWLIGKGVVVNGVTINSNGTATIDSVTDPAPVLAQYTSVADTQRRRARQALQELNAINLNTATNAQVRDAVRLTRVLINYIVRTL